MNKKIKLSKNVVLICLFFQKPRCKVLIAKKFLKYVNEGGYVQTFQANGTMFPTFTRVRMRRDFLNRLIKNHFKQLIDSIRVTATLP